MSLIVAISLVCVQTLLLCVDNADLLPAQTNKLLTLAEQTAVIRELEKEEKEIFLVKESLRSLGCQIRYIINVSKK